MALLLSTDVVTCWVATPPLKCAGPQVTRPRGLDCGRETRVLRRRAGGPRHHRAKSIANRDRLLCRVSTGSRSSDSAPAGPFVRPNRQSAVRSLAYVVWFGPDLAAWGLSDTYE